LLLPWHGTQAHNLGAEAGFQAVLANNILMTQTSLNLRSFRKSTRARFASFWAQLKKWVPGQTCSGVCMPPITSMHAGARATSSNAMDAFCDKATTTRPFALSATSPKALSTPTCGKRSKEKRVEQVMNGDTSVRVAEDVNGSALTYAEIKAIASGNPVVIGRRNKTDLGRATIA
jgi:hypothetical protein